MNLEELGELLNQAAANKSNATSLCPEQKQ